MPVERVCLTCDTSFSVKPSIAASGEGRYCSRTCYGEGRRQVPKKRVQCICPCCAALFFIRPDVARRGQGVYCSRSCYRQGSKNQVKLNCSSCDTVFFVPRYRIARGVKYCSHSCRATAQRATRVERVCLQCGAFFWVVPSRLKGTGTGEYCSRACHQKSQKIQGTQAIFRLVSYGGAHMRINQFWGRAREYPCVECGRNAWAWAYDDTDPDYLLENGLRYSIWPEFYMPLCREHHARRDGALLKAEIREYREWKYQNRPLTLDGIKERNQLVKYE
jgi:hypothetical protein